MPRIERDYAGIADRLTAGPADGPREDRMRRAVDALWDGLRETGVSWVGIYLRDGDSRALILGPCRDKPACSPIGLHGVCGRALQTGKTQIVRDVTDLGPDYIACDPRDRSEIAVPCEDEGGCWAVLDLDSWEEGAFDDRDAGGLRDVLRAAGLIRPKA